MFKIAKFYQLKNQKIIDALKDLPDNTFVEIMAILNRNGYSSRELNKRNKENGSS